MRSREPQSRLALLMPNVPQFTIAYFGAQYLGAPVVPLNVLLTAGEILSFCKERLAVYKHPRLVEFRESLPRGPTGKILKRELRS